MFFCTFWRSVLRPLSLLPPWGGKAFHGPSRAGTPPTEMWKSTVVGTGRGPRKDFRTARRESARGPCSVTVTVPVIFEGGPAWEGPWKD